MQVTTNLRIRSVHPLLAPITLQEEIPISDAAASVVKGTRQEIAAILEGNDDRLLVVVGPCSVHDPACAIDYAKKLKALRDELKKDLCVVMRVYFEKPRTTVGWKGLINDPRLDGTFRINEGLRTARTLLLQVNELGLPCGSEFLDPISPQFISGLISWGAIGARTTESQTHRELASGLSMPIGFKNGTTGNVQIAVDAVLSSSQPHHFLGVTDQGLAAIVSTAGNPDCHIILRGSTEGPNFDANSVEQTAQALLGSKQRPCVMVDASHGNSSKQHKRQREVVGDLCQQLASGQSYLIGTMIESNLVEGNQKLVDKASLTYGQSITDACISWDDTEPLLRQLAQAVQQRRNTVKKPWNS